MAIIASPPSVGLRRASLSLQSFIDFGRARLTQELAEAYARHVQGKLLAISFITVGELYFGAEKANWGAEKRKRLETTLRNFVVISYDHEIARCYGRLVATFTIMFPSCSEATPSCTALFR